MLDRIEATDERQTAARSARGGAPHRDRRPDDHRRRLRRGAGVDAGADRSTWSSPRRPTISALKYRSYDDTGDRGEYLSWLRDIALLLKRVLKDDGSFFLNIAGTSSDPWIAPDAANAMREIFQLQNSIIWVKSISIGEDSFGHFKPVNSPRYLNHLHEHVFHFTKDGRDAARPARGRRAVQGQVEHRPLGPFRGPPLRRRRVVHPLPHDPLEIAARPPSEPLPGRARRALHQAAWPACAGEPDAEAGNERRRCSTPSSASARRFSPRSDSDTAGSASRSMRPTRRRPPGTSGSG